MQVLRLLAARRPRGAVSTTISAPARPASEVPDSEAAEDEGPFFDLDFSSSSVRASSSSSGSGSGSDDSDDACSSELDFIISLHRSRSASPSYEALFYASSSDMPTSSKASMQPQLKHGGLRALSFGARKTAFYGGRRPSFARSSGSARSLRLFMESPAAEEDEAPPRRAAPSGDVIRRYFTKISRRFRSVRPARGPAAAEATRGLRSLRKSRSASAAVTLPPQSTSRRDDSLVEKQDGIAGAIAHCKESLHRASLSEFDASLLRSRSDPGKCETA